MRYRTWIFVFVLALLGLMYCAWSFHRTRFSVMTGDSPWPRPWPYPDQTLKNLNTWYDVHDPAPGDRLKIHGEWDRVRTTVAIGVLLCLWVLVIASVKIGVARRLRSQTRST
jgi:hypothetical protein